jgi:hypothetical protein
MSKTEVNVSSKLTPQILCLSFQLFLFHQQTIIGRNKSQMRLLLKFHLRPVVCVSGVGYEECIECAALENYVHPNCGMGMGDGEPR